MANIFVAIYNFGRKEEDFNAMPPFYEAFLKGLQGAGNHVLCYQHKTVGREFKNRISKDYEEKLTIFHPDLCILFCNNFWDISQIVNCPIVIYDVDSPLLYKGQNFLKENIDRYLFVVNQTAGQKLLQDMFDVKEQQICLIPFFTEIKNTHAEKEHNISFLGTNWLWKGYNFSHEFLQKDPSAEDIAIAKKVIEKFTELPFYPSHEIIYQEHMQPQKSLNLGDLNRAAHEISGLRRINYLRNIADLDLEIRGAYWTIDCMKYFPEVELCYNKDAVLTLKENEDFYNSSKISLSTNHIQAQNGFSFRVCDIMASGACLLTEEKADIHHYFPNVNLLTFSSEIELREKCKLLLSDESRRCEIVESSNEAIDNGYRFKHVLSKLEEFTSLNLHSDNEGMLEIFSDENTTYIKENNKKVDLKRRKFPISRSDFIKVSRKTRGEYELYLCKIDVAKLRLVNEHLRVELLWKSKLKKVWEKALEEKGEIGLSIKKKVHKKHLLDKYKRGEKIIVCLFVSRISCWLFDGLYHIFEQSKYFKPIVVIKPFVSQGKEAMINYHEETYHEIKGRGYRVRKGYDVENDTFLDVKKEINPDIVFYTKFWKPHFHDNFYISKFYDKITFLVPYGFYVAEDKRAMNFELNNKVDGFFLATSLHKNIAEHEMNNKGKNVIISGSPKLDVIWQQDYKPADVWKKSEKRKKRIIWAPHHEDNTPVWQYQFDSFYELKNIMFDIAEKYKDDIQIAFKPHPMLKPKLDKRWGKETANEYYSKWKDLDNGQLEEGEFIDLFLTSDAMIFDSISFIGEYTAVNKPALFIEGRNSRVFMNEYGKENYEILYHAKENLKYEICNFIEEVVIKKNDFKYQERSLFIQKYLIPPNTKNAAQNIYNSVCEIIGIKDTIYQFTKQFYTGNRGLAQSFSMWSTKLGILELGFMDGIYNEEEQNRYTTEIYKIFSELQTQYQSILGKTVKLYFLDNINSESFLYQNTAYCTRKDLETKEFIRYLYGAALPDCEKRIAFALADHALGKKMDTAALTKYYYHVFNNNLLALSEARFCKSLVSAEELSLAENTAQSLVDFVIKVYGIQQLTDITDDMRSQWLHSIEVEKEYTTPYDGFLANIEWSSKNQRYLEEKNRNAAQYSLIAHMDHFTCFLNQNPYTLSNADEVEQFLWYAQTSKQKIDNYLIENNVNLYVPFSAENESFCYCRESYGEANFSQHADINLTPLLFCFSHEYVHTLFPYEEGQYLVYYEGLAGFLGNCIADNLCYFTDYHSPLLTYNRGEEFEKIDRIAMSLYLKRNLFPVNIKELNLFSYYDCYAYASITNHTYYNTLVNIPLYQRNHASEPKNPGDELSFLQAISFIRYLIDTYGINTVIQAYAGRKTMEESYGIEYKKLKLAWITEIGE